MMYSQIVERTPSIYFKFDDQNHKNFTKSSFALDYSISNQKHVLSNNRALRLRSNNNTGLKNQHTTKNQYHDVSPVHNKTIMLKNSLEAIDSTANPFQEDEFMALHRCQKQTTSKKKDSKLKTQDFFQEFDKKYSFTFQEDDIRTHEFIAQAQYEGGSGISRGLHFQEDFQVEETMKIIQIDSKKDLDKSKLIGQSQEVNNSSNLISFTQTGQNIFSSQMTASNQQTSRESLDPKMSNQSSFEQYSSDKENQSLRNDENQFEEVISFGPAHHNKSKLKKYKASNCRHFITKDFQNNSSLLQKSRPIIEPKRRVPFKNIENLLSKSSKDQTHSQTRKKPIINTDLLISTINKTEKTQVKQNTGVWSNPINTKKSSSLECTFSYNNMFKTNAFRETLKSTTLENWKKKYHKKIEHLGEKKTVSKNNRDTNIFNGLFIRA